MTKKRIAILSNVTTDLLTRKLNKSFDTYVPSGYDAWIQDVLNPASALYRDSFDAVLFLLDGTEAGLWMSRADAEERMNSWKQGIVYYLDKSTVNTFISTIDIRENRIRTLAERSFRTELENDWYQFIQSLAESRKNVFALDIKDIITDLGRNVFYSDKMWYLSSMPYSRDGIKAVCEEIENVMESAFGQRKKSVVLDLDNTLWGGVIGEDGVEGIELSNHKEGQRFYDFQRQFLEMRNRGIVLALNSKNNPEDVKKVFEEHPDMLLKETDFVSEKINWSNKAANMKQIASELNLTQGSFVFVDDNPIERAIVSGECPDVTVPAFPEDTTELKGFAEDLYKKYFRPLRLLDEDLKKTEMYRIETQRKADLETSLDLNEYISKLEIEADIHTMRPEERERVVQLCNKTNQFNVTTKRYSAADIDEMEADENCDIFTVTSRDKYGENGLISILITRKEDDEVNVDTFLMSCRVMGRMLEDVIMDELASYYSDGASVMKGEYIKTEKNAPVNDLFDRLGFTRTNDDPDDKTYELSIKDYNKKGFDNYKTVKFEH